MARESRNPGVVVIEYWSEIIGEPKTSEWCAICAKPSGLIFSFATGVADRVVSLCTHFACYDCGAQIHLPDAVELNNDWRELSWRDRFG